MDLSKLTNEELLALQKGDYSKLSNESLKSLSAKPQETKSWYDVDAKSLARTSLEALPAAGGIAGGVIGGAGSAIPTMGMGAIPGTVAGSALGFSAGKALENLGKKYLLDEQISPAQTLKDVIMAVPEGAAQEMGGQLIGQIPAAGRTLYRSGLKRIDQELAKYGKEAASPILEKEGVWGSAKSIYEKMNELANARSERAAQILKDATKVGGEVSMGEAMAPTYAKIREIRLSRDPALQPLADALEAQAAKYMALEGQAAEPFVGSLPVGGNYTPAYSDISYAKKQVKLPVQSDYAPAQWSPLEVTQNIPGKIIPAHSKIDIVNKSVELPVSADFVPPRSLGTTPIESKIPGQVGVTSERVPGQFVPKDPVTGSYLDVIPGATYPEQIIPSQVSVRTTRTPGQFVPKEPVIGSYTEIIPGKTYPEQFVPQKPVPFYDIKEAIAGPTPIEANKFKQSLYGGISDSAWLENASNPEWQKGGKAMALGLKNATETSVGRALGPEARLELQATNDELGRLLSSKEKQLLQANVEQNKNIFTPVDAMALTGGGPGMAVLKKAADASKTTGFRTGLGYGMTKLSPVTSSDPAQLLWKEILGIKLNK